MARGTVRTGSEGSWPRGSWELRWDEPRGEDGKRRQKSKVFRGTKKGAQAELIRIVEAELSKSDAERASEMPLEECCRLFLKERSGKDLRHNSVVAYKGFFRKYLLPECGHMSLAKVDRGALQRVINRMIDCGLAANTVHKHYFQMKGFFSWAVRAEFLSDSPVKGLSLPETSGESSGQMLSA